MGTLNRADAPVRHVGNPVDVLSGNKYQRSVDYRALGSPLMFQRHYNSGYAALDTGLGKGWRHSYDVRLQRSGQAGLLVSMADGREIVFRRVYDADSANTATRDVYRSDEPATGEIRYGVRSLWQLPDGRVFRFQGSYLVGIRFPTGRSLALQYRHGRLVSVSDDTGLSIRLHYHAGTGGLSTFAEPDQAGTSRQQEAGPSDGHLDTLQLPDGAVVSYRYDQRNNLVQVDTENRGVLQVYGYEDDRWPSHLTALTIADSGGSDSSDSSDSNTRIARRWRYDAFGRGIGYTDSRSGVDIAIDYGAPTVSGDGTAIGTTVVTDGQGWVSEYQWTSPSTGTTLGRRLTATRIRDCATCDWRVLDASMATGGVEEAPLVERAAAPTRAETVPGVPGFDGEMTFQASATGGVLSVGNDLQIEIATDRLGEVRDVSYGRLTLDRLRQQWLAGELAPCADDADANHIHAVAAGNETPCLNDLLQLLELADQVEQSYARPQFDYRRKKPDPNRFCSLPPGRTCTELEHDYEMAYLSDCVYTDLNCGRDWDRVSPSSIGLSEADFFNQRWGFYARLYQNQVTGEYVLAFRGTNQWRDLWESARQMNGKLAEQYRYAIELSRSIDLALGGANFSVTGHSLGGGLATAAAIAVGKNATVFNASALHENTAQKAGIPIEDANTFVDNLVVDGDILTWLQESKPAEFPLNDTADMPTSWKHDDNTDWFPAPGTKILLPRPPSAWVKQMQAQESWPASMKGVVLHKLYSVLEAIELLLKKNCNYVP